ncbi:MAG: hypothetical protein WA891_09190 [Acidobacteriaceae bacterium]
MNSDEASSSNQPRTPEVIASFSGYEPPFDPAPIVRRMLDSVPKNYLAGLGAVVLSNAGGLSGKRRTAKVKSRKRRAGLAAARGLYHSASHGSRAWIEIFVDNTLRGWETGWWLRIPYVREGRLADVFFHELGHHIHYAVRPEHREKEDVADVWKVRLQRNYNRQRFRWIGVVGRIIRPLFGAYLERQREKLELGMLKSGQISQAEYLERVKKKQIQKPDAP